MTDQEITYRRMVASLKKPDAEIRASLLPGDGDILHMAMGISGEAGELLDAVKKALIYRQPMDRDNVIEELGDLEFFLEGFRQAFGISRAECLATNANKLRKRYPEGTYSNLDAITRADKA